MEAQFERNELPKYEVASTHGQGHIYEILCNQSDLDQLPQNLRAQFKKNGQATIIKETHNIFFLNPQKASAATITANSSVRASATVASHKTYLGDLSNLLSSAYVFSRKQEPHRAPTIIVVDTTPHVHYLISLAQTRNQTREWGNGRGDVQGTPKFFKDISVKFAAQHSLDITVIEGDDLLKEGFRLMHATGRASVNKPIFVNIAYKGNPNDDKWISYIGKGLCFDTGGLNIKPSSAMFDMYTDKLGAMTTLTAFQTIVRAKLPVNITLSNVYLENSINENAYRPADIIQSRKGLTVQIGHTDAEGRIALADAMHWTQQKFKVATIIEISTLTGAIVSALGHQRAGLFSNNKDLRKQLISIGEAVHQPSWYMPCNEHHRRLISPRHADLTNSSLSRQAGASQAAAFLEAFVDPGVNWVHFDIGGAGSVSFFATGWGSRLLVQYASKYGKSNE